MYLFTGQVPLREFAANFPLAHRLGLRLVGDCLLRAYPYREAYLLEQARQFTEALRMRLILLGGVTRKDTMDRAMRECFQFGDGQSASPPTGSDQPNPAGFRH